ncbi:hypothetical protein Q4Q34_04595 [Flavivirga abyssicola]|uniref:hypothetical protein n=1 Tax=Flavivirga abyssicola TaxID=3063533 RepID=UPI0026DF5195|nr:hypothetical protein [Flavivirga sp. MEBiC07777]WVK14307.1 hypothetical protein Q4Q34_04595 [Flavivirga sp. MEBiC07777]
MKNQILKLALFIFVTTFITSCQDDPLEDIVSNDRQFLSFKVEGQVGPTIIKPTKDSSGTVDLFVFGDDFDLSSITPEFEVSEKASVSPQKGETINFDTNDGSYTYKIVSESGKVREWTVNIKKYDPVLDGNWKVSSLLFDWQIGLNVDWGWGVFGTYDPATSSYDPANYVPEVLSKDFPDAAFEEDNTIELKTVLINEKGNAEGTFSSGAGEDNTFSSFVLDPDHKGEVRDYSHRFRKMPEGNGVWEFNELGKVITFWKGSKNGLGIKGNVTVDAQGNISINFNVWEDTFSWDHWDAESHIQSAYTIYYNFELDK